MKRLRRLTLLLVTPVLVLAACSDDDPVATDGSSPNDTVITTTTVPAGGTEPTGSDDLEDTTQKPLVEVSDDDLPTELEIDDIVVGTGAEVTDGVLATLDYVGVSTTTGNEFDDSWSRGQTIPVIIGAGSVIPGWDEGLLGMKVGGRRRLTIPPDLAYGAPGNPPDIAENDTLVFVVDLRSAVSPPTIVVPDPFPGELTTTDDVVGTGGDAVVGATASVHYIAVDATNGNEFDSSWVDDAQPFTFTIGDPSIIPGFDQGVQGMKVGGRRTIYIPPELGIGPNAPAEVQPNAPLVFVVDLVSITPPVDPATTTTLPGDTIPGG